MMHLLRRLWRVLSFRRPRNTDECGYGSDWSRLISTASLELQPGAYFYVWVEPGVEIPATRPLCKAPLSLELLLMMGIKAEQVGKDRVPECLIWKDRDGAVQVSAFHWNAACRSAVVRDMLHQREDEEE